MARPLEKDVRLELLDFNDSEAQAVFWHSSAHVLGEVCERCYGCLLEHGPPTDDGFFYDMRLPPYAAGTLAAAAPQRTDHPLSPALRSTNVRTMMARARPGTSP